VAGVPVSHLFGHAEHLLGRVAPDLVLGDERAAAAALLGEPFQGSPTQ
jgi:hypothetical protein